MFDQLTTTELDQLTRCLDRGARRSFEAAIEVVDRMSKLPLNNHGAYSRLQRLNSSLRAAGTELAGIERAAGQAYVDSFTRPAVTA